MESVSLFIRMHFGGKFKHDNGKLYYVGGGLNMIPDVSSRHLNFEKIYNSIYDYCDKNMMTIVWYVQPGKSMINGLVQMKSDQDIAQIVKSRDKNNRVDLYVTSVPKPLTSGSSIGMHRCKSPSFRTTQQQTNKVNIELSFESLTGKGQKKGKSQEKGEGVSKGKGKGSNKSEKCKDKDKGETVVTGEDDHEFEYSDDSDFSDVDFVIGEEDKEEEELFSDIHNNERNARTEIRGSKVKGSKGLRYEGKQNNSRGGDEHVLEDPDEEEDDLVSLNGSDDDEPNPYPVFNARTDFHKSIDLSKGLRFADTQTLRKALRYHSIQNRYDYWFLHNTSDRVSIYCKKKCDCKWEPKLGKIINCSCSYDELRCHFKVHATSVLGEKTVQIMSLNLRHDCEFEGYNKKVNSEYLAERYLEDWRENPGWKLKVFQAHVKRTLGVDIKYGVAWLARARAKLLINGEGGDEYGKVWEYVAALIQYNPGSQAYVVVEGIERPPPLFKRMFICLKPVRDGFIAGCRPLIGVDGCHLKGAYPGVCLVAVGKDGNNNIYPLAWAVVEVEDSETWAWFLYLLVDTLGMDNGKGLTFMSDRQKGLVDAFQLITPNAEVRYCARHIWANFKLRFTGMAFKDSFWNATRSLSKKQFDKHMAGIKFLSNDAHAYLAAIPPQCWSRHAFQPTCKSNSSTNNMCETFNSVLKDARDKPILTMMEWIRRYVMKRSYEKREGGRAMEGRIMPYVNKYMTHTEKEARLCIITPSALDSYEVDLFGVSYMVDLKEKQCSCYHWELTGLPCSHALACILLRRGEPTSYVDEAYSKVRYMMAYEPAITPMPGADDWEDSGKPKPLPPAFKTLPGRPNMKKRKKEAGEGSSSQVQKPRRTKSCGVCGEEGHNKATCKNMPVPKTNAPRPAGKPFSTSEFTVKRREKAEKKKAAKAAAAAFITELGRGNVGFEESQASVSGRKNEFDVEQL